MMKNMPNDSINTTMQTPPVTPRSSITRRLTLTSVPEDSEFLFISPSSSYEDSSSPPGTPGSNGDAASIVKKLRRLKRRLLLEQVNKPMSSILMPSISSQSPHQNLD